MAAVGAELQVFVFTGLPGTGKSTLAERVARTRVQAGRRERRASRP